MKKGTQQNTDEEQLSIKPSISEIERFIKFLNKRFSLNIKNDLVVLIQKTHPQIKGYYSPDSWKKENLAFKHQNEEGQQESINEITLNSIYLKDSQYETIAHELAHYLNTLYKEKTGKRNYHTKDFKKRAEQLLLKVEKGRFGFSHTEETEEFKVMLNEFNPNKDAFKIFQTIRITPTKQKGRLLKYVCDCGCIIRTAKNEEKPLIAVCGYCNSVFKNQDEERYMSKRQDILNWVFVDCCKNGQIKDSLRLIIENRISLDAKDLKEYANKGISIFENNTQEDIKNKPISELRRKK